MSGVLTGLCLYIKGPFKALSFELLKLSIFDTKYSIIEYVDK